jgi:LmbE family N-acetylglucosaminyl deacetylase
MDNASSPKSTRKATILVAHPDDELLWAGGFLLEHPDWDWFIGTLCRGSDPDRAPRFARLLTHLKALGAMADLDDGPEQTPLEVEAVEQQLLRLLPSRKFDILITHGPLGEYTWHLRHVEVYQAVLNLWRRTQLEIEALWLFAYEDGGRRYFPQAMPHAHRYHTLTPEIWQQKYDLLTDLYGFHPESWEALTTPRAEAFWCFNTPAELDAWLTELVGAA